MTHISRTIWLFLALLSIFFPLKSRSQETLFAPKVDYPTGRFSTPVSVAVGDFNGDGKLDLVAANASSFAQIGSFVSVLLGNGSGTFADKVDYGTSRRPVFVAAGDFNGDGKPDIVTASYDTAIVSVLLGNGNGTFAPYVNYDTLGRPNSIAIGDFNGDGKPDFAVANAGSSAVSVFINNGNGTFAPYVYYVTGNLPNSVAIGDFNGDGKLDIVAANFGSATISILFGNGNGTFAPKVDISTFPTFDIVAVGDFNGDGKPDIVVADEGAVRVFLNNGNGTFAPTVDYPISSSHTSLAVGDFNGDGKLDLAMTISRSSSNVVSVLLGNGNGTFGGRVDYTTGSGPSSVEVGDFNGDGKPDLAVANAGSDTVSVFLNIAERFYVYGRLDFEGLAPSASSQPITFVSRANGQADFVRTYLTAPNGLFAILLPRRTGTLTIKGDKYLAKRINLDTTAGNMYDLAAQLRAGDANNDNAVDIGDLLLLIAHYNQTQSTGGYLDAADFNGDGTNDITDLLLLIGNYNQMGDS